MFNFSTDPVVRRYVDAAHAERSRAMTDALRGLFRALNAATWGCAAKGPVLVNRPLVKS